MLGKQKAGWANFHLVQSESGDRYFSNNQYRFDGRPCYEFDNLITSQKLHDMVLLDLVLTDEFNEPFHYASQPVKMKTERLFDNDLNIDLGGRFDHDQINSGSTSTVLSISYEGQMSSQEMEQQKVKGGGTNSKAREAEPQFKLLIQMDYREQEDCTYVTNVLLKVSL